MWPAIRHIGHSRLNMNSDPMFEGKMKLLALLIAPVFLYACAAQETSQDMPEFETDA